MVTQKNSAKAVILDSGKVLMLRKEYEDGTTLFTLPGGTQEPGEILSETVVREVYEEVAARVEVVELAHVYEHQHQSRKVPEITKHKLEFAFVCRLIEAYHPRNGEQPDPHQVAVEWIDIEALGNINLNPAQLAEIIPGLLLSQQQIYLGEVD